MGSLLAGGMIGACIGFCLGVLAAAILATSDEAKLSAPAVCAYPHGACLMAQKNGQRFLSGTGTARRRGVGVPVRFPKA